MKPGWKTTEFWMQIIPIVGIFALLFVGRISPQDVAELWPIFVGSGAYAISRGGAKVST